MIQYSLFFDLTFFTQYNDFELLLHISIIHSIVDFEFIVYIVY